MIPFILCYFELPPNSHIYSVDAFAVPDAVKSLMSAKNQQKEQLVSEVVQLLFNDLDSNIFTRDVPSGMGFPIGKIQQTIIFKLGCLFTLVPIMSRNTSFF